MFCRKTVTIKTADTDADQCAAGRESAFLHNIMHFCKTRNAVVIAERIENIDIRRMKPQFDERAGSDPVGESVDVFKVPEPRIAGERLLRLGDPRAVTADFKAMTTPGLPCVGFSFGENYCHFSHLSSAAK